MLPTPPELQSAFARCKAIQARYGKSYFFATRIFPKPLRNATHALYAFFRLPDEIVDSQTDKEQSHAAAAKAALRAFRAEWNTILSLPTQALVQKWQTQPQTDQNATLIAAAWVHHAYAIPPHYAQAFLDAMEQDTEKTRYATYAELEQYMFGSAAAVGLMMTHVIGFKDPSALKYAQSLGEAMQLTNFLRDIQEDMDTRGRIYLPEDEMKTFGITENDIKTHTFTQAWKPFMDFQIKRARTLYAQAEPGIRLLHPSGQVAVRLASRLYAKILTKLEEQESNPFLGRASTSTWEKIRILIQTTFA